MRKCLQTVFGIGKARFGQHVDHALPQAVCRDAPVQCNGLGNLSANIVGPGADASVLHADQIFVPSRGRLRRKA